MSAKRQRRPRRDFNKQEQVVAALWDFARHMQKDRNIGDVATDSSGTRLSLTHVGSALRGILSIFGLEVTPVD